MAVANINNLLLIASTAISGTVMPSSCATGWRRYRACEILYCHPRTSPNICVLPTWLQLFFFDIQTLLQNTTKQQQKQQKETNPWIYVHHKHLKTEMEVEYTLSINPFCSNSTNRYGFSLELNVALETCLLEYVGAESTSVLISYVIN